MGKCEKALFSQDFARQVKERFFYCLTSVISMEVKMRESSMSDLLTKKPNRRVWVRSVIALLPVLMLFATLSFQQNGRSVLAASSENTGVSKKRSVCEQAMEDSLRESRKRSMPPYIPPPPPPVAAKRVGLFYDDIPDEEGGEPGDVSSAKCNGTQCKEQTLYCYTFTSEARLDSGGCCVRCCWRGTDNCSTCTNCARR
jgi:hypothetical protein